MKKLALITLVAEKARVNRKTAEEVVDALLATITEQIKQGEEVALTGFGHFSSRLRSARLGVDPLHPTQKIHMPAVLVVKFKAGKALKDALKK
ncbi:MAG: HU family DNA-binding protein [Patescibacteria group bacterium]|jgi:DNA-binding protein HU-beta